MKNENKKRKTKTKTKTNRKYKSKNNTRIFWGWPNTNAINTITIGGKENAYR